QRAPTRRRGGGGGGGRPARGGERRGEGGGPPPAAGGGGGGGGLSGSGPTAAPARVTRRPGLSLTAPSASPRNGLPASRPIGRRRVRQHAVVARARADQPPGRLLLLGVRQPPGEASGGEHHQRRGRRQLVHVADRREHAVDVRQPAAGPRRRLHHRLDVGHARVAGAVPAQHRQYLGAARVAVGIEHVVEAGQLVAAVPALVDVGGGGTGGRRVGEQGVGACGGAAVAR